jgi:acetyl-CoA synthetase
VTVPNAYPIHATLKGKTHLDKARYDALYRESVESPTTFWPRVAHEFLTWDQDFTTLHEGAMSAGDVRWFVGGKLNASVNCIDRHLPQRAAQIAILWEGDEPGTERRISYQQLHDDTCRLANLLRRRGVQKGDRVCIYMPMLPEAAIAMLACARIGAVHSVVFGGFSPEALASRILDADCRVVITADEGVRGGKHSPMKANTDAALEKCPEVHSVITVKHSGNAVAWFPARDLWYHEATAAESTQCTPASMNSEDPLFILYTSGSTGKPKGILHTTGGYLLHAAMTHKYVFDYHEGDIYWCAADVGWVTGHTYIVYGPFCNGATTLMFEGIPSYPDVSRFWQVVDKYQVNQFYTAPTAIRALMAHGDAPVKATSRASLRILGSVGEPINPEAWEWYYRVVGDSRCPVMDTWWQTETGGHMITPIPGVTDLKPGSATLPFFGVQPALVDAEGQILEGATNGNLVITASWPAQLRTVYGDHQRCVETYYTPYPGYYFTGDGARRDEDGFWWITGRVDDVLNVSGHRLGTAEIESALVLHPAVAEAAVVGYPHDIKGLGIYAYVTLMTGIQPTDRLKDELKALVAKEISPIAKPDIIQWAPGLPKTRSGKIMRRILRKVASNELDSLGDTSTLADPAVVDHLVAHRQIK